MPAIDKPLVRDALRRLEATWPRRDSALVCGDVIDSLAELPANTVDLIFADGPYNLSHGGTTVSSGERVAVDKGEWDTFDDPLSFYQFARRWIHACRRVLKDSGSLWVSGTHHSIFPLGWVLQTSGWRVLNLVTWFKPNAAPNLGCRQFTHSTEMLIWASPSDARPMPHTFNDKLMRARYGDGKQVRDMWTITPPSAHEKEHGTHPAMKPTALLDRIVLSSSNPGDLVVDPFCGSGTTGVVCAREGRAFIGIDEDVDCIELSEKRIYAVDAAPVPSAQIVDLGDALKRSVEKPKEGT